jgi:hypothetical protein
LLDQDLIVYSLFDLSNQRGLMRSFFLWWSLLPVLTIFLTRSSEHNGRRHDYLQSSQWVVNEGVQKKQAIFFLIMKSILAGGLTGAAARIADLKIFPFVGFLTEPVIRRFLLEELFIDEPLSLQRTEIVYWFSWISSWIAWYYVR